LPCIARPERSVARPGRSVARQGATLMSRLRQDLSAVSASVARARVAWHRGCGGCRAAGLRTVFSRKTDLTPTAHDTHCPPGSWSPAQAAWIIAQAISEKSVNLSQVWGGGLLCAQAPPPHALRGFEP